MFRNSQRISSGTATLTSNGSTVPIAFQNSNGQVYTNGQINCGGGPPPGGCSGLGPASNYAALGLQGATMNLSSGPLCFVGNAGIGDNVLFNFPGSGDQIQTSGKANTAGIYLAPNRVIQINGGFHNSEFISGMNLSFQSNPQVCQPCPACQPCPTCQ